MHPFHLILKPIGAHCNLSCAYCYYKNKVELYPDQIDYTMRDFVLEKVIKTYIQLYLQEVKGPPTPISFSWQGGEPTLLGLDFFQRACWYQDTYSHTGDRIQNSLQTNGVLVDTDWARFFKEKDFLVGLSLDGPAYLHDMYRTQQDGTPSHQKVVKGLEALQEQGVECNILCVVHNENVRKPKEVYEYFLSLGVDYIQFIPLIEWERDGTLSRRSITGQEYGTFLLTVFDEWVRRDVGQVFVQIFEEAFRLWSGQTAGVCQFAPICGSNMIVEHNGDVYACDHFVFPEYWRGNILDTPLQEIVQSPKQQAFGLAKRTSLPQSCKECSYRSICNGGCPKNRIKGVNSSSGHLLCSSYYHFFAYIGDYVKNSIRAMEKRRPIEAIIASNRDLFKAKWKAVGRNDSCLCGSKKKFKVCCRDRV